MTSERLRISASVRASVSGDGLVILDVRGGVVLTANPVGARIWQLVDRRLTPDEIALEIAREYDVPLDRAERDVSGFVKALASHGLVTEESTC